MNDEMKYEVPIENTEVNSAGSTANNGVAEQLETFDLSPVSGDSANKHKPKEKTIILVIVGLLVVIGGLAGFRIYKHFSENPTSIIKKVINQTYDDFSSGLKEVKKEHGELSVLKEPIRISGTLKYNDKSFKGLDRESIEYDLGLDYAKKYATGYFGLKRDANILGDVRVYLKNDKMYMESDTMFDNIYDLGENKFSDSFDLSDLETIAVPSYTTDDIDYAVRAFKDALVNSLDEKKMTISNVDLTIDGEVLKTKKITYKVDNESLNNFTKAFVENILKDDELLEKLANISGKEKDEIQKYFEFMKTSNNSSNSSEVDGELSIYTVGIEYKLVKVEIKESSNNFSYTSHKDKVSLVWEVDNTKIEIIGIKNDKSTDFDIMVNGDRYANLSVRQFDDEGIDIDYKVMSSDIELEGNLKVTLKKTGNKNFNGEARMSIGGEIAGQKGNYSVGVTYNAVSGEELPNVDVSKALIELTEDDKNKMTMQMFYVQNSAFYQYFGGEPLIPEEEYEF